MEQEHDIFDSLQIGDFDFNAAFTEALEGVVSDEELELEEKISHMEMIIAEGTSPVFREFMDFRFMAQSLAMQCAHDHALQNAMEQSETLASFMREYNPNSHNHEEHHNDDETHDRKKDTKKKKKVLWVNLLDFILSNS